MNKRNMFYLLGSIVIVGALVAGATYAAFTDKAEVLGSTFTVGSANIMFLNNLPLGTNPNNYIDELAGPTFMNIGQNWTQDYLLKLINVGTSKVGVTTNAYYETINDPNDLRSDIQVEVIVWNDTDSDGELDIGEEGQIIGKKTIIKWKTEGFDLGDFNPGQTKPLILRFSTGLISETKQGSSAIFDFEFNSIQM